MVGSNILCNICIILLLLVVSGEASDLPFVFNKNSSNIFNYTSNQIENISKQAPQIAGVPPIHTPLDNETVKNVSGINKNKTNYLLPPDYNYSINAGVNSVGKDWFITGNNYYDEGNYNKSIECYEMAIQENQQFADAWYNKGTALCKLGRYREAINAFKHALEINPNHAKAKQNLQAIEEEQNA